MTEGSDTTNPKSKIRNPKSCLTEEKLHVQYLTCAGVQVRDEAFGLLFYNYRRPRLYFVPSKDIIDAGFFNSRQSADGLIAAVSARKGRDRQEISKIVNMILTKLEEKGLIYGQSIR